MLKILKIGASFSFKLRPIPNSMSILIWVISVFRTLGNKSKLENSSFRDNQAKD